MSDQNSSTTPGFFGLLWRMTLAGTLVFAFAATASYLAVERMIRTAEDDAPDLLTLPLNEAVERASNGGFPVRIGAHEATLILSPGRVIAQRPNPGQRIKQGATIMITLSEEPQGGMQVSSLSSNSE